MVYVIAGHGLTYNLRIIGEVHYDMINNSINLSVDFNGQVGQNFKLDTHLRLIFKFILYYGRQIK